MSGAAASSTFELTVPVLVYHHIACAPADVRLPGLWICPAQLEAEMALLAARGWQTITTAQLAVALEARTCLPDRTFAITFDDGRLDAYLNGAPILEKYGFHGSFFATVGQIGLGDGPGAHFSIEQARDLVARGHVVGNHTMTHRSVSSMSTDELASEVTAAQVILENEGAAHQPKTFVYPYGRTSPTAIEYLAGDGYAMAFTTRAGGIHSSAKPLQSPRVVVYRYLTAARLLERLEPFSKPCGSVTVDVTSSPNPSVPGQAVVVEATVSPVGLDGPPTGTVQFSIDGSEVSSPAVLDGVGTASLALTSGLAAGGHVITAAYGGDERFNPGTSSGLTHTVLAITTTPDTFVVAGPPDWTNHDTPQFEFTSDTSGATFECTLDAPAWAPCTSPYHSAPLGDGLHFFSVRAVNGGTLDATPATRSFTVDTTLPYTGYAEIYQQPGGLVSSSPIEIYWQADDNLTPTAELRHEWQWRRKVSGVWRAWQAGGTTDELEATYSQPFARWYQYRVRTVDLAGNWSTWEETDPVKLIAKQETAFTFSRGWVRHTMSGAWGSYVRTRAVVGAWANLSFTGSGVALVMPSGAGQGTVNVCLDPGKASQKCTTVNLATSSPSGERRLVAVFEGLTSGSHVLRVTIVSGAVNLDGAIVRQ